jgi:hypothetical protein
MSTIIALAVMAILFMVGIYALNLRAAARIQQRIDSLKENI